MEITENRLLTRLARFGWVGGDVRRGIGDDGAVVDLHDGRYVFVQDAMVSSIHFDLALQSAFDVGRKAVYSNVSDILAMGATPLYYLVTLGIPPSIRSDVIEDLYKGMNRAGGQLGLTLLGGDTVATGHDFFVDISMTGRLVVSNYLGRDKARVGDLIAVTGFLGEAAYGLHLLRTEKNTRPNRFTRRFAAPKPPVDVWQALIEADMIHAMMDVSDGLMIDLERMMGESRKKAVVFMEHIPLPPMLRQMGQELLALTGGEDYQLLFTFGKDRLPEFEMLRKRFHLTVIGEVQSGRGVQLMDGGKEKKVTVKGYEHFGREGE